MPREPFVDERVVGAQKIQHAAILAERARQKQPRLLFERLQQTLIEVWIEIRMNDDFAHPAQVQPLSGKVVDERTRRARIGQHAPYLLLEDGGLRQLPALGCIDQALIGNAVPQEE